MYSWYWYIIKNTRNAVRPYEGTACKKAGVEPGKMYTSREEAEQDAAKLTEVDSVGFSVAWVLFGLDDEGAEKLFEHWERGNKAEGERLRQENKLTGILGGTTSEADADAAVLEAIEAQAQEKKS